MKKSIKAVLQEVKTYIWYCPECQERGEFRSYEKPRVVRCPNRDCKKDFEVK